LIVVVIEERALGIPKIAAKLRTTKIFEQGFAEPASDFQVPGKHPPDVVIIRTTSPWLYLSSNEI